MLVIIERLQQQTNSSKTNSWKKETLFSLLCVFEHFILPFFDFFAIKPKKT